MSTTYLKEAVPAQVARDLAEVNEIVSGVIADIELVAGACNGLTRAIKGSARL
jgi:hypothetical protein